MCWCGEATENGGGGGGEFKWLCNVMLLISNNFFFYNLIVSFHCNSLFRCSICFQLVIFFLVHVSEKRGESSDQSLLLIRSPINDTLSQLYL